jgi:NADP-dependent 3-hydroxy acid dehydrogenase YdfG
MPFMECTLVLDTAISADSFARAVIFAMSRPEDVDVNEILFWPTKQVG